MTETSPLGTQGALLPKHAALSADEQCAQTREAGRAVFGVEMRIVDARRRELPRDGKSRRRACRCAGRGSPAATSRTTKPALRDGWFPTGDIATIDADGYMQITDRAKDVIKSGGEWISSIDLENAAAGHPAVAMAAVIGVAASEVGRAAAAVRREEAGARPSTRRTSSPASPTRSRSGGCPTK